MKLVELVGLLLYSNGFNYNRISQEIDMNILVNSFKQRIKDCNTQNWHDNINNSSICHPYCYFKSLFNVERFLLIEITVKHKKAYAKFRCSNHKLNVEMGRHLDIPFQERFWNFFHENHLTYHIDCENFCCFYFFHCNKYLEIPIY
jgi:hypothetical protein